MDAVDLLLEDAVNNGIIAGCACVAIDIDGIFKYAKAAGVSSATATSATPMSTRSVFSLISSTKIMTVVAALQLVERGDLSLDQDVSPLLPELATQGVLSGPLDSPIALPRQTPLLLRYFLTHSIGVPYQVFADAPSGYMAEQLRDPEKEKLVLGDFSKPATYDWNLAGLMAADDGVDGRRRRGATSWFGMLNFYWFVDVNAGLCGAFGTQLLPMGDRKVNDLVMDLQKAMYDGLSRVKQQKNC